MLQYKGKYVFYWDPNDCCGNLECHTCGGRMWISDWEVFKEIGADLDNYLKEGDPIYLYWDLTDDGTIWHKEEHIDPNKLMNGIALKDNIEGAWYAEFGKAHDGL